MVLGMKFWLTILGLAIGFVVGGLALYWLFGWAWYTYGFIAAFGLLALILCGFGYVYDRREQRRRSQLAG